MKKKFKGIVFLDRDGTINEEKKVIKAHADLRVFPHSSQAIKMLNSAGYAVVVATNQPAVAKGFCTEEDVKNINLFLADVLAADGARLDAVFYCPHHPDKGFAGENPSYKIKCVCRKPNTGMFEAARKLFKIPFSKCYVIGDQTADVQAGKNSGCTTILVKTGFGGKDNKYNATPDFVCETLLDAVKIILGEKT